MGGVGSFLSNSMTLYVGNLMPGQQLTEVQSILLDQFNMFGPVVYVRVVPGKGFAFVKYGTRSAAEFAKVAMADQPVGEWGMVENFVFSVCSYCCYFGLISNFI